MKIHRIYFFGAININSPITLNKLDSHHIITVLRLKKHNFINIFNENGEWLSKIIEDYKTKAKILPMKQIKSKEVVKKWIHLIFAPLKNTASSILISKATELGVNELTQVITELTTNKPLSLDKITIKTKEAAQQCGRLTIPKINITQNLKNFINNLDFNLLWLNEKQCGIEFSQAIINISNKKFAILIGPEAGFNNKEYMLLNKHKNVCSVYFKENILKAETAGIISIGCIKHLNLS